MKIKFLLTIISSLIFFPNIYGQDTYQTFATAGFKVKSGCKLNVNSTFIQMAKQQGINNVLEAYFCAENQDNPDIGVINNINIYDESNNYNKIQPSGYASFESNYLEQYATNLKNGEISFNYTNYQGVSAIEYTFNQQGLPTQAIIFLKNKKFYLLQVGTRKDLSVKYSLLKSSFEISK